MHIPQLKSFRFHSGWLLPLGALVTTPAMADAISARNLAMGGTGVASSNYEAAGRANPALLTEYEERDDFSLSLPVIGAEASDRDDVIDTLDGVSEQYDTLERQIDSGDITGAVESKTVIIDGLSTISGQPVRGNAGLGLSFAKPGTRFAFGVDLYSRLDAGALGVYDPQDEQIINEAILSGDSSRLEDIDSFGLAMAAGVSELVFSMATEFVVGGNRMAIGVAPKYQRVDTILYRASANDFDSDDIELDDLRNDEGNFNIDLGFNYWFAENWAVGLTLRDLVGNDYDTEQYNGYQATYEIKPLATAGVAYNGDMFTVAFDADLNERGGFDVLDNSQFVRLGGEFNAANWVQLRAGYRYDLSDTLENVVTLGLGFSPFNVFHFDLTGSFGQNDTYGGALEMLFTF